MTKNKKIVIGVLTAIFILVGFVWFFFGEGSPAPSNLKVTIRYQRQPYTLTITDVSRTSRPGTFQFYEALPGNSFASLQFTDSQGTILFKRNFTVNTGVVLEGAGVTRPIVELEEETTNVFIVPAAGVFEGVPAHVQVLDQSGRVLSEQSFDWTTLPVSE